MQVLSADYLFFDVAVSDYIYYEHFSLQSDWLSVRASG
jgi:hypothetical protein